MSRGYRRIDWDSSEFFGQLGVGAFLAFCAGAISIMVYSSYLDGQKNWVNNAFRYKQRVFIAAAGQTEDRDPLAMIEDAKFDNKYAPEIGEFIRLKYEKDKSLDAILKPTRDIRKIHQSLKNQTNADTSVGDLVTSMRQEGKLSWKETSMYGDSRWWEIADNPANIKALNYALSQKTVPDMTPMKTKKFPVILLFYWLLAIQFVAYFFPLASLDVPEFSDLNRKSVKPYLTILILSPGALPLMAIHPGWTSLLKAFRTSWYQKEHSSPSIKNYKAGSCTSTQDLLKQLEARLENREGSAR